MVFSSMIFVWVFLPIVFILDKLAGKSRRVQNLLLLAASLLFYAWGQIDFLWLLLVSILLNYLLGLLLGAPACQTTGGETARKHDTDGKTCTKADPAAGGGGKRPGSGRVQSLLGSRNIRLLLVTVGILANLGILGYYKYFNFLANTMNKLLGREILAMREIVLPLGISYFTFQALTYLIDLYRNRLPAQKNILHMALYFSFFPKLTQGPIEKYRDFAPQLAARQISLEKIAVGVRRFIYGLAKKVIIADTLGACVDKIYGLELGNVNGGFAWIAILFYSLQLYYDFSGYSDMAVGLGKMFGFDLMENFNYPYLAASITDFWRKWHISLTSWFREYLYFPLGGNRKGKVRTLINILVVFMATGLWHGASWDFICWGLFHGFFQVLERLGLGKLLEKTRVLKHVYTLLVVCVGWVFFRAGDIGLALQYLKRMFLPWMYVSSGYAVQELVGTRTVVIAVCAVLGCGLVQKLGEKMAAGKIRALAGFKNSAAELAYCMLLLGYSIVLMVSSTYSAFIYMNF